MSAKIQRVKDVEPFLQALAVPEPLREKVQGQVAAFRLGYRILAGEIKLPPSPGYDPMFFSQACDPVFVNVNWPIKTSDGLPKQDYFLWVHYFDVTHPTSAPIYTLSITDPQALLKGFVTRLGWGVVFCHLAFMLTHAQAWGLTETVVVMKKHMIYVLNLMADEYSKGWVIL